MLSVSGKRISDKVRHVDQVVSCRMMIMMMVILMMTVMMMRVTMMMVTLMVTMMED